MQFIGEAQSTPIVWVLLMGKYKTILVDPPWDQKMTGQYATSQKKRKCVLPYNTMTLDDICRLPVAALADDGCHLWLWTTNQFLRAGFDVMDAWGFKYLAPVTWVKPSGLGNWFVHRTQTILFGYKPPLRMNRGRYFPTVLEAGIPRKHSEKPESSYQMIEAISDGPRVELFARPWSPLFPTRDGWDVWGNEVDSTVNLLT